MGCRSWGVRGARWCLVTGYPHHGHVHPHGHDPLALLKCGRFERHLHFPLEGAVTSMQRKGKIFPEFIYVVDKTKAYEFAKAIGDELRQVEGEFFVPNWNDDFCCRSGW